MRRFLIWTILLALVGVGLSVAAYWAYWNSYARFQPVTVVEGAGDIQALLDQSPYLAVEGGDRPVWIVGYRDSAAFQRFAGTELERLRAVGVQPRILVFARPDREGVAQSTAAERATVAELWLSRDWMLFDRWMATSPSVWTGAGLPGAEVPNRAAMIDAGRDLSGALVERLDDAGIDARWPLVIWRDAAGFLKVCACTDSRSWPFVRDDLGVPEREAAVAPPALPAPVPPTVPTSPAAPSAPSAADTGPGTRPYPKLEEILPAPQPRYAPKAEPEPRQTAPAATPTPAPRPQTRPTPPTRPRETPNRGTPQPKRDEDSTFY